eukprot:tig00001307_g8120.t1
MVGGGPLKLIGRVVTTTMSKTIGVVVPRPFEVSKLKYRGFRNKKFHAHDEQEQCKVGDIVQIEQTSVKASKLKAFRLDKIVQAAPDPRIYENDKIPDRLPWKTYPAKKGGILPGSEADKIDRARRGTL